MYAVFYRLGGYEETWRQVPDDLIGSYSLAAPIAQTVQAALRHVGYSFAQVEARKVTNAEDPRVQPELALEGDAMIYDVWFRAHQERDDWQRLPMTPYADTASAASACNACLALLRSQGNQLAQAEVRPVEAPVVTETAVTHYICPLCQKPLRSDEQWQVIAGDPITAGGFAHQNCFAPVVEGEHGETPPAWWVEKNTADTLGVPPRALYDLSPLITYNSTTIQDRKCATCGKPASAVFYPTYAGAYEWYCADHAPYKMGR